MKRNYLLIVCLTLTGLFVCPSVYAQNQPVQESFSVDPVIQDLALIPGKPFTYTLTVTNLSDAPLGIQATPQPFTQSGETAVVPPLLSWITLSPSSIILDPHGVKTMTVTLTPPSRTHNGGYYGMIFLTPFVDTVHTTGRPIILSKIGTLILATIGEINYQQLLTKITLSNFRPTQQIVDTTDPTLTFSLSNRYFTHFDARPTLTITPLFGKLQQIPLEERHILPGTERTWIDSITTPPGHFFYNASLSVSVGEGYTLHAQTFFFIFPYKLVVLSLGILLLLAAGYVLRKRIYKAITILLSNS